VKSDG